MGSNPLQTSRPWSEVSHSYYHRSIGVELLPPAKAGVGIALLGIPDNTIIDDSLFVLSEVFDVLPADCALMAASAFFPRQEDGTPDYDHPTVVPGGSGDKVIGCTPGENNGIVPEAGATIKLSWAGRPDLSAGFIGVVIYAKTATAYDTAIGALAHGRIKAWVTFHAVPVPENGPLPYMCGTTAVVEG